MLKIKKNVDLKELEKFGFEYKRIDDNSFIYEKQLKGKQIENKSDFVFVDVYEDARELTIYVDNEEISSINLDTIYDLIKADLVEKVGE